MTTRTTFLFALCIASLVGLLAAIAVLVGPANANKDPVTPQQLQAYEEAFIASESESIFSPWLGFSIHQLIMSRSVANLFMLT